MDTEFIRRNTFHPKPALIQLYTGNDIFFIDPTLINDWSPLAALLISPSILKIMHAPQEDMDVLKLLTDCTPQPLFDIQLAAAFCNYHYPCGYQYLLKELLDITIDKEETCSDWLKRPLSDTQINYAALDVYYLPRLYTQLTKKMQASHANKLRWHQEECALMTQQAMNEKDPETAWKDIKLNRPLHIKQQKVLKALCAWRECYIRKYDIPRKRTLSNKQLLSISRQQPIKLYHLQRVPELSPNLIRQYGKAIITVVTKAQLLDDDPDYLSTQSKPSVEKRTLMKQIQQACEQHCEAITINSALLPGKKYANLIVQNWEHSGTLNLPDTIAQWKQQQLETIMANLNKA